MKNYEEIFEQIVTQTGEYLKQYNLKSMVLGLSGGLDSTICAAIGKEVSKRYNVKLIGVSLPCGTNSMSEVNIAKLTGEAFCNKYIESNIDDLYGLTKYKCDKIGESTNISQGNIKARLRMIMLYNIASIKNGIVIDTDNLSEHYLGFWTIHGDVGDFKMLGKLWKTEVYKLGKYLINKYENKMKDSLKHVFDVDKEHSYNVSLKCMNALKLAIEAIPTDGNGVSKGGDMDQIAPGYTYNEVDKVLQYLISDEDKSDKGWEDIANTYFNGDMEMVDKICDRYNKSKFKRNKIYVGVNHE